MTTCPTCGHPDHDHTDLAGCTAMTGSDYCTCECGPDAPVTPYRESTGQATSGWSGSETSRQRAVQRDGDGRTRRVQRDVLAFVRARRGTGATIRDLRRAFPEQHHGTLSGTLSVLHKDAVLARLTETRDRCAVYVAGEYVAGRPTAPHGRKGKPRPRPSENPEVRRVVGEALGAASACWENLAGAGEFQSTRCLGILNDLLADLDRLA